ncbi:MAG TPA: hypothetical protein VM122_12110 [Usitatibacter sp.]|nr:hypothetical protein [Usitatibacter sp.]
MDSDEDEAALEEVAFFQLAPGGEAGWRKGASPVAYAAVAADGADAYLDGTFTGPQLRALSNIMARSLHRSTQ